MIGADIPLPSAERPHDCRTVPTPRSHRSPMVELRFGLPSASAAVLSLVHHLARHRLPSSRRPERQPRQREKPIRVEVRVPPIDQANAYLADLRLRINEPNDRPEACVQFQCGSREVSKKLEKH